MLRFLSILYFLFFSSDVINAQSLSSIDANFKKAFSEIENMINGSQKPSFKRAVFVVENAYFDDSLDFNKFDKTIKLYSEVTIGFSKANRLKNYYFSDSTEQNLNGALFKVFTDTIYDTNRNIISIPFKYDFEDALGNNDFVSTFITKLLTTKIGTCHSLPYLYKIISEELGTQAYLAFAPHHIYLKQCSKKNGWYNTELTSGQFPLDGYLMATGYISRDNIISGIYMDTLSYKQSIASCLMDLSFAYRARTDTLADPNFVLKCADASLIVYPNYAQALVVKAEMHKTLFLKAQKANETIIAQDNFLKMKNTYNQLIKFGYSEVPIEIFNKWFTSYQKHKDQYQNSEINTTFKH